MKINKVKGIKKNDLVIMEMFSIRKKKIFLIIKA